MGYGIVILVVVSVFVLVACGIFSKQSNVPSQTKIPNEWEMIVETSALISGGNSEISKAIEYARRDENILSENSTFYAKASEEFGSDLIDWLIDEDLEYEQVPCAVFKTLLYGFGYMAYLDCKSLSDPEEVLGSLNRVLRTLGKSVVKESEIQLLEKQTSHLTDSGEMSSIVIDALNSAVKNLDLEIVWFDENGDSYAFFVVAPNDRSKLAGLVLDSDHKFVPAPRF